MQPTKELTDLVVLAQSGDKKAIDELVILFKPELYSVVMKRVGHLQDCEEVVQDVFLRMLRKFHQLNDPTKFSGWIHKMASNLAINKAIRRPKEKPTEPVYLDVPQDNTPDSCPATKQETINSLRKSMKKLSENDQRLLQTYYFDESSVKEIADNLSVPIGTVKRRLFTARERLRSEIRKSQLCSTH